jgi:hypothetical protein
LLAAALSACASCALWRLAWREQTMLLRLLELAVALFAADLSASELAQTLR